MTASAITPENIQKALARQDLPHVRKWYCVTAVGMAVWEDKMEKFEFTIIDKLLR